MNSSDINTDKNNMSYLAYCGIDCAGCSILTATHEGDEGKKQAMRISIAKQCTQYYGMVITPEQVTDCDGCRTNTGRLFSGCVNCKIRPCAVSRGIENCAYCKDYACELLQSHFEHDPQAKIRLEALRNH